VPYLDTDPGGFEDGLAERVNELLANPARARSMGRAGRERAVREYGWDAIAARTVAVYESVGGRRG
jgi:alpha-maltose-1-phosphate synthase